MANSTREQRTEFRNQQGDGLDLTSKAGKFTWKIHSKLLAEKSPILLACHRVYEEQHEKIINLPDDYPTIVARMLQWLYHADYDNDWHYGPGCEWSTPSALSIGYCPADTSWRSSAGEFWEDYYTVLLMDEDEMRERLDIYASVYCIAEKYGITGLKKKTCEHVAKLFLEDSREKGRNFARGSFWGFYDILPQQLTENDEIIRRHLANTAGYCFETHGPLDDDRMRWLLADDPDLSVMLLEQLYSRCEKLEEALEQATSTNTHQQTVLKDVEAAIQTWKGGEIKPETTREHST